MKRTLFTLFFLACSLVLMAQKYSTATLQPRLFWNGKDTLFTFTPPQTREIVKRLTAGEYDQQTIVTQSKQIANLTIEVVNQRNIVYILQ